MTSIDELLLDAGPGGSAALLGPLRTATGVSERISVRGARIPLEDVVRSIRSLLGMPLGDLAMRGWRAHDRVDRARERTSADVASREVVRLLGHTIRSRQTPRIEADIGGVTVPVVTLELDVTLHVAAVDVVVRGGEVVGIDPAPARASGSLSAAGVVLAKQEWQRVELTPSSPAAGCVAAA